MSSPKLNPDEQSIDEWTIHYISPQGTRYLGNLLVTNQRLLFKGEEFEVSLKGFINEVLMIDIGSESYLQLLKNQIQSVQIKSSFFKKQVIISMKDDSQHIFDYGMLSVKKLAETIEQV